MSPLIAGAMGESSSEIYKNRADLASPADVMGPAMDGIFESISKAPSSKISKDKMINLYTNVVGVMTEKAGESKEVNAENLDATMEKLAELAAEKSAYMSTNRPDFLPTDLAQISKSATEAMTTACLEIDDMEKLPADQMKNILEATAKGTSRGAGLNPALSTGSMIADFIKSSAEGSSAGITDAVSSSTRPEFKKARDASTVAATAAAAGTTHTETAEEKTAMDDMALFMQDFSTAISGGSAEGAMEISEAKLPKSDLETTFNGISTAMVAGTATMAERVPFFKPEHIANGTKGITRATAGAIGKGSRGKAMSNDDRKTLLNSGSKGAMSGLSKIREKDSTLISSDIYTTAVGGVTAGTVGGMDDMNRNGATMDKDEYATMLTGVTTSIGTDADTFGATMFAGGTAPEDTYDSTKTKQSIATGETDAMLDATSIANVEDIIATKLGSICAESFFQTEAICGVDTSFGPMSAICEWTSGACVKRTDFCAPPATVTDNQLTCNMRKRCKWTGTACTQLTSLDITEKEATKTMPPTMAPTSMPTIEYDPLHNCKICVKNELHFAEQHDGMACRNHIRESNCAMVLGSSSSNAQCEYAALTARDATTMRTKCESIKMYCIDHCDKDNIPTGSDGTACCKALTAECMACNDGVADVNAWCNDQPAGTSTVGCDSNGYSAPPTYPPTARPTVDDTPTCGSVGMMYCPPGWYLKEGAENTQCPPAPSMCSQDLCCQSVNAHPPTCGQIPQTFTTPGFVFGTDAAGVAYTESTECTYSYMTAATATTTARLLMPCDLCFVEDGATTDPSGEGGGTEPIDNYHRCGVPPAGKKYRDYRDATTVCGSVHTSSTSTFGTGAGDGSGSGHSQCDEVCFEDDGTDTNVKRCKDMLVNQENDAFPAGYNAYSSTASGMVYTRDTRCLTVVPPYFYELRCSDCFTYIDTSVTNAEVMCGELSDTTQMFRAGMSATSVCGNALLNQCDARCFMSLTMPPTPVPGTGSDSGPNTDGTKYCESQLSLDGSLPPGKGWRSGMSATSECGSAFSDHCQEMCLRSVQRCKDFLTSSGALPQGKTWYGASTGETICSNDNYYPGTVGTTTSDSTTNSNYCYHVCFKNADSVDPSQPGDIVGHTCGSQWTTIPSGKQFASGITAATPCAMTASSTATSQVMMCDACLVDIPNSNTMKTCGDFFTAIPANKKWKIYNFGVTNTFTMSFSRQCGESQATKADCESMCFCGDDEQQQSTCAGSYPAIPAGKQYRTGSYPPKMPSSVCFIGACDSMCFEAQTMCGADIPANKKYGGSSSSATYTATTTCGSTTNSVLTDCSLCFVDVPTTNALSTCGNNVPQGKQFATGITSATPCAMTASSTTTSQVMMCDACLVDIPNSGEGGSDTTTMMTCGDVMTTHPPGTSKYPPTLHELKSGMTENSECVTSLSGTNQECATNCFQYGTSCGAVLLFGAIPSDKQFASGITAATPCAMITDFSLNEEQRPMMCNACLVNSNTMMTCGDFFTAIPANKMWGIDVSSAGIYRGVMSFTSDCGSTTAACEATCFDDIVATTTHTCADFSASHCVSPLPVHNPTHTCAAVTCTMAECCTATQTSTQTVCNDVVPQGKQYGGVPEAYTATTTCGSITSVLGDCRVCFVAVPMPTCSSFQCPNGFTANDGATQCPVNGNGCDQDTVRVCGVCARNELAASTLHRFVPVMCAMLTSPPPHFVSRFPLCFHSAARGLEKRARHAAIVTPTAGA